MGEYVLSCESTVDLTKLHLEERNISYICYPYELDHRAYRDDFGASVAYEKFYSMMAAGAETKTQQINAYEFEQYFSGMLSQGKDIVHLCLSSGITGVMNSAQAARANLIEKYPARKIYLIDSLAASSGFGLLVDRLADLRDAGMDAESLTRWAEANRLRVQHWFFLRVQHWFFSEDLKYYVRGGRISRTAGAVGTLLGICPLLDVNADGRLVPREKIRSKKRAVEAIVGKMAKLADDGGDYADVCYVSYSGGPETAEQVAALVRKSFPRLKRLELFHIGTIIGSHSGPGTVALFFWGAPRAN